MTDLLIEWQQFLTKQGARFTDEPLAQLTGFNGQGADSAPSADYITVLHDLGLIAWSGEDAATFLHNQLTNDIEKLGGNQARLAGYCSAKGRLLATMTVWRKDDDIVLQLPRQLQAAIQKRLQMFVLRAKAKARDAGSEWVVLGLAGNAAAKTLQAWFPQLPQTPFDKVDSDAGTLIRLPDDRPDGGPDNDAIPRYQWIASPAFAQQVWPQLTQALTPVGPQAWRLADIRAGLPTVTQATQEQFVPQMINFELIGGVNFKKGCYPGQEIVARSQYLGKLKRRMLLAVIDSADVAAGMEVFASSDPEQPCGMIVNAEHHGGRSECLVEIKVAVAEDSSVHLGSAQGALLQFKPLPYALPDPA
jgi:folate-binding protein YgfZ